MIVSVIKSICRSSGKSFIRIASRIFLMGCILTLCSNASAQEYNGLSVKLINQKPSTNVIASYEGYDKGGNTSVAFDAENIYKWSGPSLFRAEGWGYFTDDGIEVPYIKRDRDLGQTFQYEGKKRVRLQSIIVSTGYGSNVVRPGMYGKSISLQIFEVTGEPMIHTNGSDSTIESFHGFPHNRKNDSIPPYRDDYFQGEVYHSIAVFRGGVFPSKSDFGFPGTDQIVHPGHEMLKGRLLKFTLPQKKTILLQPGKRYGFLIMIDKIETETGFTLANHYWGNYTMGHGIRRDGNGVFPPILAKPEFDFENIQNKSALESAHFPNDFTRRISIPPGTNGYPDVDTFRDFVFFIEVK